VSIGATAANGIARWNGATWSALGAGVNGEVRALTSYDDGGGSALYVGGWLTAGVSANCVARWRNGAWSALPGLDANGLVYALEAFDDGSGSMLYAGGNFSIGGLPVNLAVWNGAVWTPITASGRVTSMAVHDDGAGPALFVSNETASTAELTRLRGGTWTTLPLPYAGTVAKMLAFQGRLWLAGVFGWAGPDGISCVQSWDGVRFQSAFRGLGTSSDVHSARVVDAGNGPRLYAGGTFQRAGRTPAYHIASFDGTTWSSLGAGVNGFALALESFDDGTGAKLYVGGTFLSPANHIASWNGTSWAPLGSGVGASSDTVYALQRHDDGTGMQLYAGGRFSVAGAVSAARVARWNGSSWSPVGAGFDQDVLAFAVYDEGAGPRLFAGGRFTQSGGAPAVGVARWDGVSWTPVGVGLTLPVGGAVYALCVFDDGSGPKLYAGGSISASSLNIACWDGSTWSGVGAGFTRVVSALCVHDDGTGPQLFAGIQNSAQQPIPGVWRLNASSWTPLDGAPGRRANERIGALVSFDDPSSDPPALYALGYFAGGETISSFVAKWSRATEDVPICIGDGSGTPCPCGNASASAAAAGCLNSLGLAGTLRTSGAASVASDSLTLLGTSMPGTATALYFQGTTAIGLGAGAVLGDGLRCAGGAVVRLGTVTNTSGTSQLPDASHPTPLSSAGAIPTGGGTRIYQAWYRNVASFCTPSGFNLTNGVSIAWQP
jgi:hypothetical protein